MNLQTLQNIRYDEILVMGNQAADLDSCVSAYSLSALISILNPGIKCLPLVQGHLNDLSIKPEIISLFCRAGVSLSELVFTSELNEDYLRGKNVILVDHNHPEKEDFPCSVTGIIDHHKDSRYQENLALRDIRVCGSCSSIISEYWHISTPEVPHAHRVLLAGTIEVDTGGLSPEWGKATALDREQFQKLTEFLPAEDRSYLKTLEGIKNNLGHLSMTDHLKRDFKTFPMTGLRGGISSVPLPITDFFSESFYDADGIERFSREHCPGFLLIMHSLSNPLRRELSLYCPPGGSEENKTELLLLEALKALDTVSCQSGSEILRGWHHFRLNDPKTSRKILVPLLMKELS